MRSGGPVVDEYDNVVAVAEALGVEPIKMMRAHDIFWARVVKGPGCWTWTGTVTVWGYGLFQAARIGKNAHRWSYQWTHGVVLPRKRVVRHTCDNKLCVRPSHLVEGTQAENIADKVRKNRQARGTTSGNSKLTEPAVVEIRERRARGEHLRDISADYGVTCSTVGAICSGESWSHVGGPITRKQPRRARK